MGQTSCFFEFFPEAVPKIHIVFLSEAKNLSFSFQLKKSKEEILRVTASG